MNDRDIAIYSLTLLAMLTTVMGFLWFHAISVNGVGMVYLNYHGEGIYEGALWWFIAGLSLYMMRHVSRENVRLKE
ncbi:MAG: hypothetical protein ACE5KU_04045 [Nitrososphaerales archaeon]